MYSELEEGWVCPFCLEVFFSAFDLLRHVGDFHEDEEEGGGIKMRRISPNGEVWCPGCKQYKSPDNFWRDHYHQGCGFSGYCKSCTCKRSRDYQRQYYLRHRDILLPRHRKSALESSKRRRRTYKQGSDANGGL